MNTKATIVSTVVFIVLIAGMFGYALVKKQQLQEENTEPQIKVTQSADRFAHITRVTAKHFYIDGVHTFAGEIIMPTPCDLLEAQSLVAESFPEQITIDFSVINNAEFCAQVETPQRFKVSATASNEAQVNARFNGRSIELNLVPAAEGETPDEFELFIKG